MQPLDFYTLDVFTNQAFSGNPLAVFPDAEGLESTLMEKIAREMNLSETVFIGQSTAPNRFAMRIFTPAQEMPFAGHPTVGTALLLQQLDMLSANTENPHTVDLVLEQGIGDVKVSIDLDSHSARFETAQLPQLQSSPLTTEDAGQLLGLDSSKITSLPFIASCGYPFHIIELSDPNALAAASLDTGVWKNLLAEQPAPEIYLYCRTPDSNRLRARMFAPAAGIGEDPATGSAAAALAGALATKLQGDGIQQLTVEQGVEMGRTSLIETSVCYRNSSVQAVYISGQAILVSRGSIVAL
ncbi:MAG: PhzF family phenazine biosynthesis protein [Motiliproteus sp.]|nr:PhzF family phenazine biosynthesis protein [Motiliproteus sp.]MCW9051672.1 PhzF family phenazine biosynthesis protein [Motiliproteus sp.]